MVETGAVEQHADASAFEAAGLYDPASPGAPERLELLEYLTGLGLSVTQMSEAQARERLPMLAADAVVRPEPGRYTLAEVADKAGVSLDMAQAIRRAAGLRQRPDDEVYYTDTDAALFEAFGVAAEIFGDEPLLQLVRVMGSSMSRLAEASVSLFQVNLAAPVYGEGELAVARVHAEAIRAIDRVPQVLEGLFRFHLVEAVDRLDSTRRDPAAFDRSWMAVGFVDLVGFTPLSEQVGLVELGELIEEFEAQAFDAVSRHGGRVVKLIGDEVMFVTGEAEGAAEVALNLLERFSGEGSLVMPRGGLAFGEVLTRSGDYYGSTVNAAARIAEMAVPREILATRALAEVVQADPGSGLVFEPAGRRLLKGFGEPMELMALSRGA